MNLRVPGRWRLGTVIIAITLAVAGCGGGPGATASSAARHSSRAPKSSLGAQPIPDPAPTGMLASTTSVRVIRAWSSALRRGDVRAAAKYFALPSVMINGPDPAGDMVLLTIRTRAEAVAANAGLPCGARFISADQRGRYVNALFELTNRPGPGGGCAGGAGQTARTNLIIRNGLIVEWIRAPDDPGDNATSPPPSGPASQTPSPTA